MKKKIFTLLTLLLCLCSGAWGQDYESTGWDNTENSGKEYADIFTTHGTITISTTITSLSKDGNRFANNDYIALNGAVDGTTGTYMSVKASTPIQKISVRYSANDVDKAYNLAWVGWEGTPNAIVDAHGVTTGITKENASKSIETAIWEEIDVSSHDLKEIRFSRQTKNFKSDADTKISSEGNNNTVNVVGIKVWLKAVTGPSIVTQPADAKYLVGAEDKSVSIVAAKSNESNTLTYQWYSCDDAERTNAAIISGATSNSYAINTSAVNTFYYYCIVTEKDGEAATVGSPVTSDVATIKVVTAEAPEVSATIDKAIVRTGTTVTLTASITAGMPEPTLQWYTCDADGTNAAVIDGATSTTYQPSTATGTYYFLVKASNSAASDVASNVVKLKVVAAGTSGTVSDLVAISSDYTFIADDVTLAGTTALTANTLYDDGHIFTSTANQPKKDKGTSTIDGETYYNSLNLRQGPIAFKVSGPCKATFYTGNNSARSYKIGTSDDDDKFGICPNNTFTWSCYITEASTVYITRTVDGDYCLAGFKLHFSEAIAPANAKSTYVTPAALDFSDVEGLKAYVATGKGDDKVIMTKVDAVPASTPLMLVGSAGSTYDVPFAASASTPTPNYLVASTGDGVTFDGTETNQYILYTDGLFHLPGAGTLAAGKAYLDLEGVSASRVLSISFSDDETTGIEAVNVNTESNHAAREYYNLNGQRVANPTKGLYIVNGKKVIMK